jgi:hypothetical protein
MPRVELQNAVNAYTGTGRLYGADIGHGGLVPVTTTAASATSGTYWINNSTTATTGQITWVGGAVGHYYETTHETVEQKAKRIEITSRADQLWQSQLSDEQRRTWNDRHYVDVKSQFGRRYRIKKYRSGNVYLLDALGREVRKYCAYGNDPGGSLPEGDHYFIQMVTLRFNEREFLRMANTWDELKNGTFVGQGADADAPIVIAA